MANKKHQIPLRLDPELANKVKTAARAKGTSVNAFVADALAAEIERVRQDPEFTGRVQNLMDRDAEILRQLAKT